MFDLIEFHQSEMIWFQHRVFVYYTCDKEKRPTSDVIRKNLFIYATC